MLYTLTLTRPLTHSHKDSLFIYMVRYMENKWIIKWVENQLDSQAQRAVISRAKSSW